MPAVKTQSGNVQDASGKHLEAGVEGANAASGRAAHFLPLAEAATSLAGSQESLSRLLRAALATHDPVLSHLLFRALIADGAGSALISSIPDSGALRVLPPGFATPAGYREWTCRSGRLGIVSHAVCQI